LIYYEALLIVNPNLSEEDVENLSQKIKKGIEDLGASVIHMENWGKRRLTYEVKKSKKGYYLIYDCSIDSKDFAKKVDGLLRYNEEVLKYMTIKMRKKSHTENERAGESLPAAVDGDLLGKGAKGAIKEVTE